MNPDWRGIGEKTTVAVVTAIVLGILTLSANWASQGGLVRTLGGVTQKEVEDTIHRLGGTRSLAPTAVVAFTGPCPPNWRPFAPAISRFIIGAGTPSDPKHRNWKRSLPTGGFEEVLLTTRELNESGGEEAHTLTVAEMPTHAHDTYRAAGNGTGLYPQRQAMGPRYEAIAAPTQDSGGGRPHSIMPPFIPLTYCINLS